MAPSQFLLPHVLSRPARLTALGKVCERLPDSALNLMSPNAVFSSAPVAPIRNSPLVLGAWLLAPLVKSPLMVWRLRLEEKISAQPSLHSVETLLDLRVREHASAMVPLAPAAAANWPAGQPLQLLAPSLERVPAGQPVQLLLSAAANWPAGQAAQLLPEAYFPAAHPHFPQKQL